MNPLLETLSVWTARDVASCALAFVSTLVLLHSLIPLARRIGLVDRPYGAKIHTLPTPLVGGIAMFTAFALTMPMLDIGLTPYRPLLVAGAMLVIVGVLDDFKELSSTPRLAAQIIAALMMCYWGEVRLVDMGALKFDGGITRLGIWEVPLTVFCVIGVINAVNMIDGLDGLASGLASIAFGTLAYAAAAGGVPAHALVLVLLTSATLAFWFMNAGLPGRSDANVFMGDGGSLFLGFALAWFVIELSQGSGRVIAPAQALWIAVIPLMDTVRLLIWRAAQGQSPFKGDQEHLHHVLRRLGVNAGRSVGWILAMALGAAVFGVTAPALGISELSLFYGFMGLFTAYALFMAWIGFQRGLFGRPMEARLGAGDRRHSTDRRVDERRRGGDRRQSEERRT